VLILREKRREGMANRPKKVARDSETFGLMRRKGEEKKEVPALSPKKRRKGWTTQSQNHHEFS